MRSVTHSYYSVVLLFVCCLPSLSRSQQRETLETKNNVQPYLATLKSGTTCQRRAAIIALHHMGKSAIPVLIEHIDDHDVAPSSTLMLANPMLSYAPPGSQRDEFSGVIYAYIIELILARNVLHDDKDCTFLLSQDDYAYGHGLIMKGKKVIPSAELAHVKQWYSEWWEKNRKKGLSTLRFDWKKSIRPLAGSGFEWM